MTKSSFLTYNKGSAQYLDISEENNKNKVQSQNSYYTKVVHAIQQAKDKIERIQIQDQDYLGIRESFIENESEMHVTQSQLPNLLSNYQINPQNLKLLYPKENDEEFSKRILKKASLNQDFKEVELDFVEDEDDQAEKYLYKMITLKQERTQSLKNKNKLNKEEIKCKENNVQEIEEDEKQDKYYNLNENQDQQDISEEQAINQHLSNQKLNFSDANDSALVLKQFYSQPRYMAEDQVNSTIQQTYQPLDHNEDIYQSQLATPLSGVIPEKKNKKRRVTICVKKNNNQSPHNEHNGLKKRSTNKKKSAAKNGELLKANLIKIGNDVTNGGGNSGNHKMTGSNKSVDEAFTLVISKTKSQINNKLEDITRVKIRQNKSFLNKLRKIQQYNELVLADKQFKQVYAENLNAAIFTFPKFKRNYSKNYSKIQQSYAKSSKKKKTIVFDIDETLVFAAHNSNEMPSSSIDATIKIKVNRFGGTQKAYLSFRPYVFEMLEDLFPDFELILYTCGTQSYAAAFSECVHKWYQEKYPEGHSSIVPNFCFFDHILSLQQCLYSVENDLYIKDLKILENGRDLCDIVIVDNNIQSFYLQLTNGIPIYDYEGDKTDNVLINLTAYLRQFKSTDDVRIKINKDFQIMHFLEEKGVLDQVDL
ncbi:nli interacting factor-like phosphatase family protein [Stylonychia lemnae]|uniref:Nli interacting factor-like phosphatase family protein n=1 Tax=Stylonychia lemnae TaxID=5949 RepID=A0A078BAS6_STYLE|nr:nli interacting factor-like phosphatase family protein [Stylonychia lemnae]|eukprot:CDW90362.1 nli interacting factor-like phosphatase family protein [Stylonychia lemnae]